MHIIRKPALWSAFAIIACAMALPVRAAPPEMGEASPVLIGVNIPRTGPLAPMGALLAPAIQLAVDQINASGGVKSLGGAPIALRWADNEANPSLAASEEQRLIEQEKVVAVIGGGVSGAELTASQMAERLKVPHLVSIATADEITQRGFHFTFLLSARAIDYAHGYLNVLNHLRDDLKINIKKIIVLNENSALGSSVADDVIPLIKKGGYKLIAHIAYPASTSDVSSILTRIRSARPDVVLHIGYIGDSILIWNTRRQLGMEAVPFIGITSGIGSPAFMKAVGKAATGALTLSQTNADIRGEAVQAFVNAYQAKYHVQPENNGFFAYQAAYVVKAALERAGSRDPQALRDAFATLKMEKHVVLPQDAISFNATGANRDTPVILLQIRDAHLVTVWPPKFASAKPNFDQFERLRSRGPGGKE